MNKLLVAFEGPPESGCTTHSGLLSEYVSSRGFKCKLTSLEEAIGVNSLDGSLKDVQSLLSAFLRLADFINRLDEDQSFGVVIFDRCVPTLIASAPEEIAKNKSVYYAIRRILHPGLVFPRFDVCFYLYSQGQPGVDNDSLLKRYRASMYGFARKRVNIDISNKDETKVHKKVMRHINKMLPVYMEEDRDGDIDSWDAGFSVHGVVTDSV